MDTDADHREVLRILTLKKSLTRRFEMIIRVMTGFEDIVGKEQDAKKDKPFDLRAPDDSIRIDLKTQASGELNVKSEKVGKQLGAWVRSGRRFVPVQVVMDSKTGCWYVVAGIPTASRTALDPLDSDLDPNDPCKPFCLGACRLEDLKERERFETMRAKLNEGLNKVRDKRDGVLTRVEKERQAYVKLVAEQAVEFEDHMIAIVHAFSGSEQAMNTLADSDEAMAKLAQSDKAMAKLAQSDEALAKLAQSDEAMRKLAQSDEAMRKLLGPTLYQAWKAQQSNPPAE